jgi:two-component system sensor histidine kinase KdpD
MYPSRRVLDEAHVALAYLLVVQIGSARHGRSLGLTLAALGFLCFDVLFLPPYGTLLVDRPLDVLVLAGFLVTSVVAAHLFERARAEAERSRHRAVEVEELAGRAAHADALRQAARLKDDVIVSVSHDLRTPLTTIKALAHDLAVDGDERAMTIEEEADRLNALVANLLDLSRLSSGAISLVPEPNEAEDLLGAALQRTAGTSAGREIRTTLDAHTPLLFGRFDFTQTLRVLVNLLENALKYSPREQPVDLGVQREGAWLTFTVADRGPGIPATESERVFEPFYRPPGVPPDVGGAGLGLSIARALAEAQAGTLSHEPRPGGGTIFRLRVPAVDVEELGGA